MRTVGNGYGKNEASRLTVARRNSWGQLFYSDFAHPPPKPKLRVEFERHRSGLREQGGRASEPPHTSLPKILPERPSGLHGFARSFTVPA
jgi:hypothetical protein